MLMATSNKVVKAGLGSVVNIHTNADMGSHNAPTLSRVKNRYPAAISTLSFLGGRLNGYADDGCPGNADGCA